MTIATKVRTATGNAVLDCFMDNWTDGQVSTSMPLPYIWGFPLSELQALLGGELRQMPKILSLTAGHDGVKVRFDYDYFSYLFRGTLSPDEQSDSRRTALSTIDLFGKYVNAGFLTHGIASDNGGLHTTRSPMVAFGADGGGSFSSPHGSILLIDKSILAEVKSDDTKRPDIEEIIFSGKVPLSKVAKIYVHEDEAKALLEKYGNSATFGKPLQEILFTHDINDMKSFRKEGLLAVMKLALTDSVAVTQPRYQSKEARDRLVELSELAESMIEATRWQKDCSIMVMSRSGMEGQCYEFCVPSKASGNESSVLYALDKRTRQIGSAMARIQRKVPEAYADFDLHADKIMQGLEEAKSAVRTGKVALEQNAYEATKTTALFPDSYSMAFAEMDNHYEPFMRKFTGALIKEIDTLEQKYSERAVN